MASLLSFQNLSPEERAEIAGEVQKFQRNEQFSSWPGEIKILAIGFAFLTIAGEDHFVQMINSFRRSAKLPEVDAGNGGLLRGLFGGAK